MTALHTDISGLCTKLADGDRFVVSHRGDGFSTIHVVPAGRPPAEQSGWLHNFPTPRDANGLRATLDGGLVKLHEIVGAPLDALVQAIVDSIPTSTA